MQRFTPFVALGLVLVAGVATGQHGAPPANSQRKVATRVAPVYPALAHRLHLQGMVKMEAQVRPNGTVKSVRICGGNPVLADAAIAAVEKWRFDAAQDETTEVIQISFEPQ